MICPYCGSGDTFEYYHTIIPTVDRACDREKLSEVKLMPLVVEFCKKCGLGFNTTPLSMEYLEESYKNYVYISPADGIGQTKFDGTLRKISAFFSKDDELIEIGCSDGFLIEKLNSLGYNRVLGIDPSPQAEIAIKKGLNVRRVFFTDKYLGERKVDGFLLVHTFEHFENPFRILKDMISCLKEDGKIFIEVPNFEGYHHEHLFFYNAYFMDRMFHEAGLKLIDISYETVAFKKDFYLRCVAVRAENPDYPEFRISERLKDAESIAHSIAERYKDLYERITTFTQADKSGNVYWWGAGSASVVFLNNIDKSILDNKKFIVVDGDKEKLGKFIPGVGLEVYPYSILKDLKAESLIVASSHFTEIQKTLRENDICPEKVLNIF
ncbi:MAG: class I SAM-dependent methyltransferase [Deltaproteobacteria bacterium]|nr:class I SAM-dependent methyltransferase [Deltaproteobacteria bacterium]